jgi:uncharacterized tellurite resistance protein B-like protein
MSILDFLRKSAQQTEAGEGETRTVRKIVAELEAMEPEQARFIAAFAYILSRVANADLHISAEETRKMEEIVQENGHIPENQAILVVQIAKSQNQLFGGTEDFLVTREFRDISTLEQRRELLDCLFRVSAADDSISSQEESHVRQIASELGFEYRDYIEARSRYSEKREIMRPFYENDALQGGEGEDE